jgi:DNA-binding CsgD family transcriptional regulator
VARPPLHERTLAVIEGFYEAALDENLWPVALKQLTELTHSQAASFWVLDGSDTPRLPTFIYINFDVRAIKEYLEHTAAIDPTNRYLLAHPRQPIVHTGMLGDCRDKDSRAYNDWHERHVDTKHRMVGQVRLPRFQAGIALHRTHKVGRYEPRDIARFEVLYRHLERALGIAFRLGSLGAMQQLTTDWLDRSSAAIIFLDQRKRIIFANRRARELHSEADGIRFRTGGEITLLHKPDHDRLQSAVAQAVSPIASTLSMGPAMRVQRPSGKRPYSILVGRVNGSHFALSSVRPAVCLVISDPERQTHLPTVRLQELFGLTEAEARLASLLGAGQELRLAAEQLGITYGTARVCLSQIFQKTDTRRQAELVHLLMTTLIPS